MKQYLRLTLYSKDFGYTPTREELKQSFMECAERDIDNSLDLSPAWYTAVADSYPPAPSGDPIPPSGDPIPPSGRR